MSTSAYWAARQSNLPSERPFWLYTLGIGTQWCTGRVEWVFQAPGRKWDTITCTVSPFYGWNADQEWACVGSLVSFVNLGGANNRDIERLLVDDMTDSTNGQLADHVFGFMARAVFKPSLAVLISHCLSLKLSGKGNLYASLTSSLVICTDVCRWEDLSSSMGGCRGTGVVWNSRCVLGERWGKAKPTVLQALPARWNRCLLQNS